MRSTPRELTAGPRSADHLRYGQLQAFDRALNHLDAVYSFTSSQHQVVSEASDEKQLIVAERGPLLFVFNFSPDQDYEELKVRRHLQPLCSACRHGLCT